MALALTMIFSVAFSETIPSQSDSTAKAAITFLPNATIDLGDMKSGTEGKGTLRFRNDGDAPLQILRIFTGCSCTDARYPQDPIPPGGEGEISVTFRSKGYSKGSFLKTMKVKSNASSRIDRVFIKGRVTD